MSLQKLMYVTAVPFNLARIQTGTVKTFMVGSNGLELTQSAENTYISTTRPSHKRTVYQHGNTKDCSSLRIIRKKQNIFKNKADAHAFREKARLKRELLEKELLNLKLDKMRLLWENNQLKIRQSSLEAENLSLKQRLENSECHHHLDAASSEGTLEHASFVNFPLPKDRVLPQMLTLLMWILGEVFNNLQMQPYLTSQASNIYLTLNKCVKSVALQMIAMTQTMCLSVP